VNSPADADRNTGLDSLTAAPSPSATVGRIPVRNLWLLMLYASQFHRDGMGRARMEEAPDEIPVLVAEVLCALVDRQLHRGISPGFRSVERITNRVRGRIDLRTTATRHLLQRGQVACQFDELTLDTPRHRFVVQALRTIAGLIPGNRDLAHRCRSLALRLTQAGVSGRAVSEADLMRDPVPRHDRDGQRVLMAARLAMDLALPLEDAQGGEFLAPHRAEVLVRQLFEKAVGGFYQHRLTPRGWQVTPGQRHGWPVTGPSPGFAAILPGMVTDIILDHAGTGRRLIIDTKFTAIVKPGHYGQPRLSSGHLYQLFTYLHTVPRQAGYGVPSGILLHPAVGLSMDESATIQEFPVRVVTVDLAGTAGEIAARLESLVGPWD
jgi:5-methylcytosine-specific restriction enzyme subunit McrC